MPRRHRDQTFRQADLTRAVKAMRAAGVSARYEIDSVRKTITIIVPGEPPNNGAGDVNGQAQGADEWDRL